MNNEPNQNAFVWQVRVYWEDTDAGGVVYHAQYVNFFERARTEWLRSLGVHQARLAASEGMVFAIRRMELDWLGPARLDDVLDVSVHSVEAGGTRIRFSQGMTRHEDGLLLARAEVTAVCLDGANFKPRKMPEWIRAEIDNVE